MIIIKEVLNTKPILSGTSLLKESCSLYKMQILPNKAFFLQLTDNNIQ